MGVGTTSKRRADYSPVQSLINAAEALPFGFMAIGLSENRAELRQDNIEDRGRGTDASGTGKDTEKAGRTMGRILAVNQKFCQLCECRTREELYEYTGGFYEKLVNPDDLRAVRSRLREEARLASAAAALKEIVPGASGGSSPEPTSFGTPHHNFLRLLTKNGHEVHLEDTGSAVDDPIYGRVYMLYVTVFTESRNQNVFDLVTGLYQKEYLNHWMMEQREYNPELFQDRQLAVVYLNCRDFRVFNETFGYEAGNRFLKQLGEKIEETLCTTMASRVYADQFIAYCDAVHVKKGVQTLHEWVEEQHSDFDLWLMAGVYYMQSEDQKLETIADYAKIACDRIPVGSKNYLNIYSDELARKIEKHEYIQTHIDDAVKNGWMLLYLQPVVRTLSGKVCSAEALARWDDPKYGMISPGEFVPALEEKNLSYKLALFVIDAAAKLISEAQKAGKEIFPISVNFSRRDFDVIDPYAEVEKAVLQYGIQRNFICIEITESMAMEDPVKIQNVITRFHRAGYEVWMDDFGSAYSSLNTLKDFDFDEIKLDMVFMRGLNDKAREIVASCVNMAKRLGVHTLCEGVETDEQLNFLRDIGCERIQGFYYSRPRPPKDLYHYMEESGLGVEDCAERHLFDSIGSLLFDADTSWMLTMDREENSTSGEYSEDMDRIVYFNPRLRQGARRLGLDDSFLTGRPETGSGRLEFEQRVRTVIREAEKSGREEELAYFRKGHYFAISSLVLARFNGMCLSKTVIRDTTEESKQLLLANADPVTQSLVNLYDSIYRIDPRSMRLEIISSVFPGERAGTVYTFDLKQAISFFYWKDRERFRNWAGELLAEEKKDGQRTGSVQDDSGSAADGRQERTGIFRVNRANGAYSWEAITVIPYEEGNGQFLICLKPSVYENEKTAREVAESVLENCPEEERDDWSESRLWEALTDQGVLKLFWKDRERRFVGASKSFLHYYGFRSANEVIGKTDEEIGWHVDDRKFFEIEEGILRNGNTVRNAETTIMVFGRAHRIRAAKFPIMRNGQIIGLMGFFEDLDECEKEESRLDESTGFMDFLRWASVLSEMETAYQSGRGDYEVVMMPVRNYWEIRNVYGTGAAEGMASSCAEAIRDVFGGQALYSRIDKGTFVAALKERGGKEAVQLKLDRLKNKLSREIWTGGFHGRAIVFFGMAVRSECGSMIQTVSRAAGAPHVSDSVGPDSKNDQNGQ